MAATITPVQIVVVIWVCANQFTTRVSARTSSRMRPVTSRPMGTSARPSPRSTGRQERRASHPNMAQSTGSTVVMIVTRMTMLVSSMRQPNHMRDDGGPYSLRTSEYVDDGEGCGVADLSRVRSGGRTTVGSGGRPTWSLRIIARHGERCHDLVAGILCQVPAVLYSPRDQPRGGLWKWRPDLPPERSS